ncbi:hypothetical protein [Variovorax sp. GT1P44]|uniref:hypothetical protein n=1 Tax=Variovorax sp. GT1P44 TaxID=3443742 RepID=UPI003F48CB39
MPASIRRIAIYVDATGEGAYRWVLIEHASKPSRWTEIKVSPKTQATYREAMADGLLALQGLVGDLDEGPREAADSERAPTRSGSRFGFGDLPAAR